MNFESEKAAKTAGEQLIKKLRTKGWEIRVHENIGWHLALLNKTPYGGIALHTHGNEYFCLTTDEKDFIGTGKDYLRAGGIYTCPNLAVEAAFDALDKFWESITKLRDKLFLQMYGR